MNIYIYVVTTLPIYWDSLFCLVTFFDIFIVINCKLFRHGFPITKMSHSKNIFRYKAAVYIVEIFLV